MSTNIRPAAENDAPALKTLLREMGFVYAPDYIERSFQEMKDGKRLIFMAEENGVTVGYAQLCQTPLYPLFSRLDIWEIQDLCVTPNCRRQGVGSLLIDHCENIARAAGKKDIGISVGLFARYGAAQQLYVQKGYVPDGTGICYDDVPVRPGDRCLVDDDLTLKMVKKLL